MNQELGVTQWAGDRSNLTREGNGTSRMVVTPPECAFLPGFLANISATRRARESKDFLLDVGAFWVARACNKRAIAADSGNHR